MQNISDCLICRVQRKYGLNFVQAGYWSWHVLNPSSSSSYAIWWDLENMLLVVTPAQWKSLAPNEYYDLLTFGKILKTWLLFGHWAKVLNEPIYIVYWLLSSAANLCCYFNLCCGFVWLFFIYFYISHTYFELGSHASWRNK